MDAQHDHDQDVPTTDQRPGDAPNAEQGAPTKVCPSCSVAERTTGGFCPHCGTSYDRSVKRPRRRRRISRRGKLVALALVLVLAGTGTAAALVTKHQHDQDAKHKREQLARTRATEHRRAVAEQAAADRAAEAVRKAKEAEDAATRSVRRSLVNDLRKSITKDARGRVADGFLDGPIYGTQCDPVGGGNLSNLHARTGRYSCLAYNKKNDDGTIEGYGFTATVNYEKFSYQWHLGNQ
jgi:hypothetical protein